MFPEINLRQEITPRRVLFVGGLAVATGTALAIEVRSHGLRLPTRQERHLELPNNIEAQMIADPTQFAGV